jgi:uncharacterized membrane protein
LEQPLLPAIIMQMLGLRSWHSKGQLMPTIAVIAAVLLGVAALGTDVFLMYWTQQNLQRASDAAAMAGATYLALGCEWLSRAHPR